MNEQEKNKLFTRDSSDAVTQKSGVSSTTKANVSPEQARIEKLVENDH